MHSARMSSFGSRNSAIGLATTRTLDPTSPDYRWTDEGWCCGRIRRRTTGTRSIPIWCSTATRLARVGQLLGRHQDAPHRSVSALQISTLVWEDGWPKVGALP